MKKRRKNIDSDHYGPEPTEVVTSTDQIYALNWYNYFYDSKSGRKWLVEYCRNNKISLDNVREVNMTMCSLARMFNRGIELPESSREYLHRKLAEKAPPKAKKEKKVATVRPYNFGWMEEILDEFYTNGYQVFDPGIYKRLSQEKTKISDANYALEYYSAVLDDVENNRNDYISSGKKAYRAHVLFLKKIVDDLSTYAKATRKPHVRKRSNRTKAKSATKIVSNVKFQLRDDDLKVVSEPPEKLIGATEVFLYNTKYRTLQHYVADGPMNIRGTTLQGFDVEKSTRKTLRKPDVFFKSIKGATVPAIRKEFNTLKTKSASVNGRLNDHTIILKVK